MRKIHFSKFLTIACAVLLAGCSSHHGTSHHGFKSTSLDPFAGKGSPYYRGAGAIPFGGGRYQVGNAYQVAGRWFTPHEQPGYDKTGVASWYGEAFHRRKTSNGEWFDMNTLTAAHATLPLPSYAMVTNLDNGRQVVVRINDRGPFVSSRVLDVSKRAADVLGYRNKGTAHVRVKLIGPAPLNDSNAHMLAMNDALNNGASLTQIAALGENTNARASNQVAFAKPRKTLANNLVQLASFEPPPVAIASAGYIVRVAVFHSMENATSAYNAMSGFGPTQIIKAVGANGPLYRVQIGPLENEADANAALQTAIASGFADARIVTTQITQVSSN
jgi:rare lipoprotein A